MNDVDDDNHHDHYRDHDIDIDIDGDIDDERIHAWTYFYPHNQNARRTGVLGNLTVSFFRMDAQQVKSGLDAGGGVEGMACSMKYGQMWNVQRGEI